jgi:hypothetical protein
MLSTSSYTSERPTRSPLTPTTDSPPTDAAELRGMRGLIVTHTGGRSPRPRQSTTSTRTAIPVAILPLGRALARSLICASLLQRSLGLPISPGAIPASRYDSSVISSTGNAEFQAQPNTTTAVKASTTNVKSAPSCRKPAGTPMDAAK